MVVYNPKGKSETEIVYQASAKKFRIRIELHRVSEHLS